MTDAVTPPVQSPDLAVCPPPRCSGASAHFYFPFSSLGGGEYRLSGWAPAAGRSALRAGQRGGRAGLRGLRPGLWDHPGRSD